MFRLKEKSAKLINLNIRPENHGDEKVLGCDLRFEIEAENTVLDMFDPELRKHFFKEKPAAERDLVEQGQDDSLTVRRFPNIKKAIEWEYRGVGYRLEINIGISGYEDIYAIDTKLDKWKFELQEGGTVKYSFRVQCHPEPEEIGRLSELLTLNSVTLTLDPPSAEDRAQMELDEARENLRNNPAA